MKYLLKFIFPFLRSGVEVKRGAMPPEYRNQQNDFTQLDYTFHIIVYNKMNYCPGKKRGVEFYQSTRNAFRIRQKVENGVS